MKQKKYIAIIFNDYKEYEYNSGKFAIGCVEVYDQAAAEVIATAFPDAVFDGTAYVIEPGISRRKVLVPAITDVLNAYPHE